MGSAAVSMVLTYSFNNYFWGKYCARLPFEPFGVVTGMSHRGLEGDDMKLVSMTFLCVLF